MTTPTFLHVPYNGLNASNQSSAAIAASCDVTYKLHPVVVMSILDHYKRRQQGQGRVVGTLLGERKGDRVVIKHAFPVPHEEGEDQIKVDMDYHSNMLAMHQKVNPRDTVVGWYSTSDTIGYISALIHGAYRDVVLAANSSIEPVLLTVDVSLTNNRLAIKAYTSSVLKFGGREILARFECAPLELHAYEAEKIGIDALLSGHPDEGCGLDAPALLFTENEALAGAMDELSEAIEICSSYVERVKKGEIDGDPELGESISNALAAIPHVDAQSFSQLFNSHTQDLLMLIYLANLTKTQINIADKVGAVV